MSVLLIDTLYCAGLLQLTEQVSKNIEEDLTEAVFLYALGIFTFELTGLRELLSRMKPERSLTLIMTMLVSFRRPLYLKHTNVLNKLYQLLSSWGVLQVCTALWAVLDVVVHGLGPST